MARGIMEVREIHAEFLQSQTGMSASFQFHSTRSNMTAPTNTIQPIKRSLILAIGPQESPPFALSSHLIILFSFVRKLNWNKPSRNIFFLSVNTNVVIPRVYRDSNWFSIANSTVFHSTWTVKESAVYGYKWHIWAASLSILDRRNSCYLTSSTATVSFRG